VNILAALLLIGVFLRHHTAHQISAWTGWTANIVYYVEGGLFEVLLCGVLATCLLASRRSLGRDLALVALGIGAVEGLLMALFQMFKTSRPPPGVNTGDWITGLPLTPILIMLSVIAVIATYLLWWWKDEK
jgi:hypothetical protein